MSEINLDEILESLGSWGNFQKRTYLCMGFVFMFSVFSMSYIFTARDIKYRCRIPQCDGDDISNITYNPPWLKKFVPYTENVPNRCLYYEIDNNASNACDFGSANSNRTLICDNFVYERSETTIVQDFHIYCDENLWKLTSVGTINVIGELICLSYSGFISDRYGRKMIMIISVLISSFIGTLRSFSVNYVMYVVLEFLDTSLAAGMYEAAFILAIEVVSSTQRNIANTIISCFYCLGQIVFVAAAWASPSWRLMLRILYLPGLVAVLFFFTVPESVRWLLSVNRKEEAKKILEKIARSNNKTIPTSTLDMLLDSPILEEKSESLVVSKEGFKDAITNVPLFLRTALCAYVWCCVTFVYYGLTIHSVDISDDVYVSFLFAAAIEMPAYFIYYIIHERIGRRKLLCSSLILGGLACVSVGFTPLDYYWVRLWTYLTGKCCLTLAYTVLYVYTSEMFPTCSRHSMFSICSMFGRFGSMVAPQVPLMARVSKALPLLMFGIMAGSSGAVAMLFPETLNTELPDTIEEAVNIGKRNCDTSTCSPEFE